MSNSNRDDSGRFSGNSIELSDEHRQVLDDFGAELNKLYDKQRTIDLRKQQARYFIEWLESNRFTYDAVTDQHVRQYISDIADAADTYVSSCVDSVSRLYMFLTDSLHYSSIDSNPTADIDYTLLKDKYNLRPQSAEYLTVLRREQKTDLIALRPERIKAIFSHMGNPQTRNELIARLAWETALRADELSRIKVDKIDRNKREIRIRSSKLNPSDHPDLYERRVYYSAEIDPLLDEWLYRKRPSLPDSESSEYLFMSSHSDQMTPSYISRLIKEGAHRADDEGSFDFQVQEPLKTDSNGDVERWALTAHRIRHSRISYWANETDMQLTTIRKLAGHAQIQTTMSYVTTDWSQVRRDFERNGV